MFVWSFQNHLFTDLLKAHNGLVRSELSELSYRGGLILLVVGSALATLGFVFYRQILLPLRDIRERARTFAAGGLDIEIPAYAIREVDEVARAINQMRRELSRLEQMRRDFVANVSHELKTPITSIKGFTETLLDGAMHEPEEAKRFLEIVSSQADRLGVIIEDLLALSRLETENLKDLLRVQSVRAIDLVKSAVEVCAARAANKGISLRVQCPPEATFNVDRSLLVQALVNLVDNAIKYSEPNKNVTVVVSQDDGELKISVRDEGVGIAHEHLSRVFERFYRVDKARSRNVGGTGLGLAIVKHIASVHSGKVSVESVIGQGSNFTVHLPR